MTIDQLHGIADELALRRETVKAYAARRGINYSTLISQCRRAGFLLGREVRQRRVAAVVAAKQVLPSRTWTRLALDAGFSSPQAFHRARRSLTLRHGVAL